MKSYRLLTVFAAAAVVAVAAPTSSAQTPDLDGVREITESASAKQSGESSVADLLEMYGSMAGMWPGSSCAEMIPRLVFTKEDFATGFSRTYRFPDMQESCDGDGRSSRGGTLRLDYKPATRVMHAVIQFQETFPCSDGVTARRSLEWSGDLRPIRKDPLGEFPAAAFHELKAKPKVTGSLKCPEDEEPETTDPTMQLWLGLVYTGETAAEVIRTPWFQFLGGMVSDTFAPNPDAPEKGRIELEVAGCLDQALGSFESMTATGRPEGGTYTWNADPSSVFGIDAAQERAIVTAEQPGRATLIVEYATGDGETASRELRGSVVELRSVNGGAPIPEIGLYDENGRDNPPTEVPIEQLPPDGELLTFRPADPAIATLLNDGTRLLIQGVRPGSTTAQADTACGDQAGPVIAVNVVRCRKETVERMLEREMALGRQMAQNERRQRDASGQLPSKSDVALHTGDAFLKVGEVVSAGASALPKAAHAIHKLEQIFTVANSGILTAGAFSGHAKELAMYLAPLVNPAFAGLVTDYEIVHSLERWVGDLHSIVTVGDRLAPLVKEFDDLQRKASELEKLRLSTCGDTDPKAPKPGPRPDPVPGKKDPPKAPPKPAQPEPAPVGVGDGVDEQPPTDTPPPPESPEPPVIRGLPIDMCRCDMFSRASWGSSPSGLKSVVIDMQRAEVCGQAMLDETRVFAQAVERLSMAAAQAERALGLEQAEAMPALTAASEGIRQSTNQIESFVRNAGMISTSLEKCQGEYGAAAGLVATAVSTAPGGAQLER